MKSMFIMNPVLRTSLTIDILSAAVTHLWFRNHEPELLTVLVVLTVAPIPSIYYFSKYFSSLFVSCGIACALYLGSLLISIATYRLSIFHPLSGYPGPFLCKLTKIWGAWVAYRGKLHLYYRELHKKYGPVVRVGPNELSIADPSYIRFILGGQAFPKGPLWEGRRITPGPKNRSNQYSLIGNRDSTQHARVRKAWNRAFSSGPLKDYEESLKERGTQLVNQLQQICISGSGVGHADIAKWITYFSFDFMGDMAFGGGFELMRTDDETNLSKTMDKALIIPGFAQHIPWFAAVIRSIPLFSATLRSFGAFAVERAKDRALKDLKKKDLFYHLTAEDGVDATPFPLIVSNAVLTIIAGSDTTATVLSNIVYYLLRNPQCLTRLRTELEHEFPPSELTDITLDRLSSLKFLNAVINETLRLQPAVPTSLQRAPAKGSGGKMIGNMFIKEGTAIVIPPYVLHRDPANFFPRPDDFWPERWLETTEDIILNRTAFIPFSHGPADCAGKLLAMQELRYITTLLILHFHLEFDGNYDPSEWEKDLKDRFVMAKGKLLVKMNMRIT